MKKTVLDTDAVKAAEKATAAAREAVANSEAAGAVRDIRGDIRAMKPKIKKVGKGDAPKADATTFRLRDLDIKIKMSAEVKRDETYVSIRGRIVGFGMGARLESPSSSA